MIKGNKRGRGRQQAAQASRGHTRVATSRWSHAGGMVGPWYTCVSFLGLFLLTTSCLLQGTGPVRGAPIPYHPAGGRGNVGLTQGVVLRGQQLGGSPKSRSPHGRSVNERRMMFNQKHNVFTLLYSHAGKMSQWWRVCPWGKSGAGAAIGGGAPSFEAGHPAERADGII